jgi:hypothetical protein
MTARRPVVIISGLPQEIPAGDCVADPVLTAISQILGRDGATLLEVEAKYGAFRATLRPNDAGPLYEQVFNIGHHAFGFSSSFSATTTFTPSDLAFIGWFSPGYMVIRKLWVTCVTSAVAGTRAGNGNVFLRDLKPLIGAPSTSNWCIPPQASFGNILNNLNANVQNFHSLKQRQLAPQCVIAMPTAASAPNGSMNWTATATQSTQAGANVMFGVKSQVGIDLPPTMLIDVSAGQQPVVLEPSQGQLVGLSYPAAVTSQVVNFSINMVWDEWYPTPQVTL